MAAHSKVNKMKTCSMRVVKNSVECLKIRALKMGRAAQKKREKYKIVQSVQQKIP